MKISSITVTVFRRSLHRLVDFRQSFRFAYHIALSAENYDVGFCLVGFIISLNVYTIEILNPVNHSFI